MERYETFCSLQGIPQQGPIGIKFPLVLRKSKAHPRHP